MKTSKNIENFLNFYDAVKREYDVAFEMVGKCDQLFKAVFNVKCRHVDTGDENLTQRDLVEFQRRLK